MRDGDPRACRSIECVGGVGFLRGGARIWGREGGGRMCIAMFLVCWWERL